MIIETKYPFSEERLKKGKLNDDISVYFVGTDPRCVQVSTCHGKKEKDSNIDWEPLTTLKKYRMEKEREQPIFGSYFQLKNKKETSFITMQDKLFIDEFRDKPEYLPPKAPFDKHLPEYIDLKKEN